MVMQGRHRTAASGHNPGLSGQAKALDSQTRGFPQCCRRLREAPLVHPFQRATCPVPAQGSCGRTKGNFCNVQPFSVLGSAVSQVLRSRGGKGEWGFEAEGEQWVHAQVAGKDWGQLCPGSRQSASSCPADWRDVRLRLRLCIRQEMLARLSTVLSVNVWSVHLRWFTCTQLRSSQAPGTSRPMLGQIRVT